MTDNNEKSEKKNQLKKNKNSVRDLWYNIKCTNIYITGVPEGKGRECG